MTALSFAECAAAWQEATRHDSYADRRRWDCAPTALASSGTSRAQAMADALTVDVTTVHNLAKAQMLYLYLYEWDAQKAMLARAVHSYIRFEAVWRKHHKYELPPADCLDYLNMDLSNDATEALIESVCSPDPEWRRRLGNRSARSWLAKIATEPDNDQPSRVTRAALLLQGRIEEAAG